MYKEVHNDDNRVVDDNEMEHKGGTTDENLTYRESSIPTSDIKVA